jgi:hypothetical protein
LALSAFADAATTDAAPKVKAAEAIPPRTIKERRVHSIDWLAHFSGVFCSDVSAERCSTFENIAAKIAPG